jgi:N-hydroxyarylamine O-acetyltransferase
LNVEAYLERIRYVGSLIPSGETLRALQVAHLLAVPFENLSIHSGEPIILDEEALFRKVVDRRRGGFCYECNGLFGALLRELGFNVTMLSAEVANEQGGFGPPFDHMALLVNLEQAWLADVGFGDSFIEPLLLDERGEQGQRHASFSIVRDGAYFRLFRRNRDSAEWKSEYRFTLQPYNYDDFAEMCRYHQTSPESHFTQKRICSKVTSEGRVTLSDMRYISTSYDGLRIERTLDDQQEYAAALSEQFGIVMSNQPV